MGVDTHTLSYGEGRKRIMNLYMETDLKHFYFTGCGEA